MTNPEFDPARLRRVQHLFDAAMDLQGEAREQWLVGATANDPAAIAEVRRLIEVEERALGLDAGKVATVLDAALRQLLPDALAPGIEVGAYLVESEIGAGGMGRVFRARRIDPTLAQEVAIKVVRREVLGDNARARFESERAMLARLRHPGICQFIDAGTLADGSPYFVMEFLADAVPIASYADRERLDVSARIALFRQVLAATAYAHQNLVVHRDIKASNVLVLPGGQAKLLDFGIAKTLSGDGNRHATATGDRFFSIATAAPEQLTGAPVTVGCDIYSLGVLLYELLAGSAPFDTSNTSIPELIDQVVHRVPPSMRTAATTLDDAALAARQLTRNSARRVLGGEIEDIVQRCLRKDPEERYHSVDALDEDLRRLQEGLPISIRRGQNGYRLRKFIGRHRIASVLGAALLISLIASAWVVALQNIRIRAERDQANEALAILRDAFLSADPARFSGESVSARQVMDSAYNAMQQRIGSNSATFLDLLLTMAEVELSLDGSERALTLTTQARAITETSDVDPAIRDRLTLLHASALSGNGKSEEAKALLQAFTPQSAEQRVDWLIVSGRNLSTRRELEPAEQMLREAVRLTMHLPPTDRSANRARRQLAENLAQQDQAARAVELLEQTRAWQRTALSDEHPYVLLVELLTASELRKLEREDEAIAIARRASELADKSYGAFSAISARSHMTLGNALIAQGDYAGAETSLRKSRDALERILGRWHPNTVRAQFNLAVALDEQQPAPATTRDELQRALDDIKRSSGADGVFAVMATLRLVMHLADAGLLSEARRLFADSDLQRSLAADTPAAITAMAEDARLAIAGVAPGGPGEPAAMTVKPR